MEEESQSEQGGVERRMAVAQMVQIKYILAGILALVAIGRAGDWSAILTVSVVAFAVVGSICHLVSIHRRRKATAAEGERRMRQFMRDLKQAEEQVQGE